MTPKISVLMATYNDAPFLRQAINTILDQTFTDFEFIIINDGSTDETSAILDSFHDPRIRRIDNPGNLKLAASLNSGLEVAQGEYICRMDSDDISLPERLQKQIDHLENHPEIGVLGTQYRRLGRDGEILELQPQPLTHGLIMWQFLSRFAYPLLHPSTVMRRDFLESAGGYNENYSREQDGELFLRLIHSTRYANLADSLYVQRVARTRTEASEVFDVSYLTTLEIRGKCIESLLEREVSIDELAALIFPTSRRHRLRVGFEPSLPQVKGAIGLLIDIFAVMDDRGHFTKEERLRAHGEIGNLVVNMLKYCKEFTFETCNTVSSYDLVKYLRRRVYRVLRQHATRIGRA